MQWSTMGKTIHLKNSVTAMYLSKYNVMVVHKHLETMVVEGISAKVCLLCKSTQSLNQSMPASTVVIRKCFKTTRNNINQHTVNVSL